MFATLMPTPTVAAVPGFAPAPSRAAQLVTLVRAMARGDADALALLYDTTSQLVYSVTRRVLRNDADADEVTADVYERAWRFAAAYDPGRGSVDAWLVVMARSRAIDRLRARRARAAECAVPARVEPAWEGPSPAEGLEVAEARRRVHGALEHVPAAERELILLAFFGGHTHSALAALTGLPLGTVKTRIRQGLLRLRRALEEAPPAPGSRSTWPAPPETARAAPGRALAFVR